MASGGDDPGKSTPLKDFLNLGRKAFTRSPDTFQDARDDLMIPKLPDIKVLTKPFGAGIKIPAGTIDPKASRQGLTTQSRKGSRSDLRPDETDDNLSTAPALLMVHLRTLALDRRVIQPQQDLLLKLNLRSHSFTKNLAMKRLKRLSTSMLSYSIRNKEKISSRTRWPLSSRTSS